MSDANSAYAVVLADLRAKRAKIDAAIEAIEELSGERVDSAPSPSGPYTGMAIHEATKAALRASGKPMGNAEIAAAIQEGGLSLRSADVNNTVGAVLTRRAKETGDIVKAGRGVWALPEWGTQHEAVDPFSDAQQVIAPERKGPLPATPSSKPWGEPVSWPQTNK